MDPERLGGVIKNTLILVEGARILGLPILVTEQYPKGIGPTVDALRSALGPEQAVIEKLSFSCAGEPAFLEALKGIGRDQIIVTGMETHVCVLQTVRDLLLGNLAQGVFCVEDAMISRTQENHRIGLSQMAFVGAMPTGTESVLFDLLVRAGSPEFKAISRLVK